MNIIVLSALDEATGNATTAYRISGHLRKTHDVTLIDVHETRLKDLKELVRAKKIDAGIGLHALLSGPWLHALKIPYALIMGGTDLYQDLHKLQVKQMVKAVLAANEVVAFGKENLYQAFMLWPEIAGRGRCIAQAVNVDEIDNSYNIRERLNLSPQTKLAILPAGIRVVKDPFFLVQAFSQMNLVDPDFHVCLAGPILEPAFAEENLNRIQKMRGIHHIAGLPRPQMLTAIKQADILLNSSLAEGMSSAILEAMALSTPVVARVNDGNVSIVKHGHTGFLFTTPSEAVEFTKKLMVSKDLRKKINDNCKVYLEARHSIAEEFGHYNDILLTLQKLKK